MHDMIALTHVHAHAHAHAEQTHSVTYRIAPLNKLDIRCQSPDQDKERQGGVAPLSTTYSTITHIIKSIDQIWVVY